LGWGLWFGFYIRVGTGHTFDLFHELYFLHHEKNKGENGRKNQYKAFPVECHIANSKASEDADVVHKI
jgi:hypothetical protein